jgi:hypothetical protein
MTLDIVQNMDDNDNKGISSVHPVLACPFRSASTAGQLVHAPTGQRKQTDLSALTHPFTKFRKPMRQREQQACSPVCILGQHGSDPTVFYPLGINGSTLVALPDVCAPTLAAPPAVHQCRCFVLRIGFQCSGPL